MDILAGQPTGDSEVALELVDAGMETFHCLSLARLNEYPRRNLWEPRSGLLGVSGRFVQNCTLSRLG